MMSSTDPGADVIDATEVPGAPGPVRIPKYWRLKSYLLDLVASREPGSALPPERTLAQDFGVSRTTVRQALQEMVLEGRLERIQGSGTFVARPKVMQTLSLTSYTEDMTAKGLAPSARILEIDTISAGEELSQLLNLNWQAPVLRIRRLRLANNEPMAIETTHLSQDRFPELREHLERTGSLYTALHQGYGVDLAEAVETIESALADPAEAAVLGVDVGLPMLLLSRHSFDQNGPVEWVRSIYRGDRYRFVTRLNRPHRKATENGQI